MEGCVLKYCRLCVAMRFSLFLVRAIATHLHIAVLKRGEVCPRRPMPYAHGALGPRRPMPTEPYDQCPMPTEAYAVRVPHLSEKGYIVLH